MTRIPQIVLPLAAAAAFTLSASPASADCTFDQTQGVRILSTHWNDVLFYYYTADSITVAGPVFGHRTANYGVPRNEWIGSFLYDYALGRFTEASYYRYEILPFI